MDEKLYRSLEYDEIKKLLAQEASTATAKENLMNLSPSMDILSINRTLDRLRQAVDISSAMGRLPVYGYEEISEHVKKTQKGGTIQNGALLKIVGALRTAKQIKRYIFCEENPSLSFPLLEMMSEDINGLSILEKDISACILSETEIADNASSELYDIRKQIRTLNAGIKDKLNSLVTSHQTKKYLQEAIVTLRAGRYVVPVKSEHKNDVQGIVHDVSSTGMTLYVEPAAIVSLNNKLRTLEIEERKEIDRILEAYSRKVENNAAVILNNERITVELDELFARAEYAFKNAHTCPTITTERQMHLRKARHPLLPAETAVASDIAIGEAYNQLVITGPNTGGKTVTLKTLGICALMAQSALFVPCADGSRFCAFDNIFADIGDEQSIAQSLSTFSSHMKNIVEILAKSTPKSLVLLDEVGAGTDPSEGAALAWSILDKLRQTGLLSLATTHYNEIKKYALTIEGVINASMEFDVEKLRPTYKLNIGIPGKSNAFEISKRLGLDEEILENARQLLVGDNIQMEELIGQIEQKLRQTNEAYESAAANEKAAREKRGEIERDLRAFSRSKDKLMTNASLEAKEIVSDARKIAREIISEAQKYKHGASDTQQTVRDSVSKKSKEALDKINANIPRHDIFKESAKNDPLEDLKAGDEVFVTDLNSDAAVIEVYGDEALIQIGAIKTRMPIYKLAAAQKTMPKGRSSFSQMKAQSASPKLDIRGITAGEVSIELEKFLDDSVLAGLKVVTVVHGKGNGVLRKAVDAELKNHPLVENYRLGGLKEGGEGATIVNLV